MILKEKMSFADARQKCREKSFGELASITSSVMQELIDSERKKNGVKYMWIGLKRQGNQNMYLFISFLCS